MTSAKGAEMKPDCPVVAWRWSMRPVNQSNWQEWHMVDYKPQGPNSPYFRREALVTEAAALAALAEANAKLAECERQLSDAVQDVSRWHNKYSDALAALAEANAKLAEANEGLLGLQDTILRLSNSYTESQGKLAVCRQEAFEKAAQFCDFDFQFTNGQVSPQQPHHVSATEWAHKQERMRAFEDAARHFRHLATVKEK